jgi:hypothetical protein
VPVIAPVRDCRHLHLVRTHAQDNYVKYLVGGLSDAECHAPFGPVKVSGTVVRADSGPVLAIHQPAVSTPKAPQPHDRYMGRGRCGRGSASTCRAGRRSTTSPTVPAWGWCLGSAARTPSSRERAVSITCVEIPYATAVLVQKYSGWKRRTRWDPSNAHALLRHCAASADCHLPAVELGEGQLACHRAPALSPRF